MVGPRLHLPLPVADLAAARAFYGGLVGCAEGRSASDWVDVDFHGHQIVAHLDLRPSQTPTVTCVDGQLEFKAFADEAMIFAR